MSVSATRPLVTVHGEKNEATGVTIPMPAVFRAPIRPDVVNFVHTNIAKNHRQPYGVDKEAGHKTSAESWGTGRAVARIPRVRGGGTHRSGQGAFGNMCRGGHMFAPNRVWRRWHRRVNTNQKRYAMVSAIAASGNPAIVMSKGHMVQGVSEFPLVVTDKIQEYKRTKQAVAFLAAVRAWKDVKKVKQSHRIRAGKGKRRNRRRIQRRGPLIVYYNNKGLRNAFRNIPGVDCINVMKLNLLKVAPGGHLGRFIIWTESAFKKLDELYGTWRKKSTLKSDYNLPMPKMANTDLTGLLRSEEIKKFLKRPKKKVFVSHIKKNPLRNPRQLVKLNPYVVVQKRLAKLEQAKNIEAKKVAAAKKEGVVYKPKEFKQVDEDPIQLYDDSWKLTKKELGKVKKQGIQEYKKKTKAAALKNKAKSVKRLGAKKAKAAAKKKPAKKAAAPAKKVTKVTKATKATKA